MGELFVDLDLLNDMIKALGVQGAMEPKALAKLVGRSEEAILEQLTQSYYFQPATIKSRLGRYELSGKGQEQFEKISRH
jgi:hypothetical protein